MTTDQNSASVPDSYPAHTDPSGELADMGQQADVQLVDERDPEELREFIEAAETGELGDSDPGLETQVRMARSVLEDGEEDGQDE